MRNLFISSTFILLGFLIGTMPIRLDAALPAMEAMDPFAKETLSVTNSAASAFTASVLAPTNQPSAKGAMCTVETNDVRFWIDGSTPTTTVGMFWGKTATSAPNDPIVLRGSKAVGSFRVIATSGTASLSCTYFR